MTNLFKFALVFTLITSGNPGSHIVDQNTEIDIPEANTPVLYTPNIEEFDIDLHLNKYLNLKSRIKNFKTTININSSLSSNEKVEVAQEYLSFMLVDSIFPYWIGTPWDFNGHTDEPMVGEVACGYFVSTTIRHMDVKINRFKVAQKASSDIIKELCDSESIRKFNDMDKLEDYLETEDENNVLIIGLDFHVGFIYKKDGVSYFAHSNYENAKGVEIVPVKDCHVLESSNVYVLGSFSSNTKISKDWLRG